MEARFLDGTRERIVTLLWRADRTVGELVEALGLTGNAVRGHLAALERDGLVRRGEVRRGAGKPAAVYTLTPAAERLFPSAYARVLHGMLDVAAERLGAAAFEALVRDAGRRLAAALAPGGPARDLRGRAEQATALLAELGGAPELDTGDGALVVRSHRCPLGALVLQHPEVCRLMETLLTEAVGAPVHQACAREDALWCVFELPAGVSRTAASR
jgi:predicted ArsR family transcriptional regulator